VNNLVRSNCDTDINMLVSPFSKHPHHRIITNLFLSAIYQYNRDAKLFFMGYKHDMVLSEPGFSIGVPNIFYYFVMMHKHKKEQMIRIYESQKSKAKGRLLCWALTA
jgi:hypothetical protein